MGTLAKALGAFDSALLAPGSAQSLDSRLNTAQAVLMHATGDDMLPLTIAKVRTLGAALKAGGYKSARQVLQTVRAEHAAANHPWPGDLARYFDRA